MNGITLVTGGARSGKSVYAEQLCSAAGESVLYIATAAVSDEEMQERIKIHRARRPKEWVTLELWTEFESIKNDPAFESCKAVLLDCIGFALNNHLYHRLADWEKPDSCELQQAEGDVELQLAALVKLCRESDKTLAMVTNEVGDSLVPETAISRAYRDMLGRINCYAAELSDNVVLMTCGLPLVLKEKR